MKSPSLKHILFLLFGISGFSGLIYESIWSHYLKLFLGHAAYAQTLVLAIFMGGMAIGAWIASKYSIKWKNLLLGYAIAEGLIGIMGLAFHGTFIHVTEFVYTSLIPSLGSPTLVEISKWSIAGLLILPQSILLGMTFPLMSAGIIRLFPTTPGGSLAILYFSNSLGAAIGVLTSGFVLIEHLGLPGTILTAALLNIVLALVVWALVKDRPTTNDIVQAQKSQTTPVGHWYYWLLATSLLTGTASFIYEIGWIRMLSLVLGSSTHAFELMLSAFIFGLAFGGFWIRRRIDKITNTIGLLAILQLIMGILALSTLPIYGHTFEMMQWIISALNKTDAGYAVFNLSSHLITLLVMLPTTFCAGMTLPLITYTLLRQGHGEKSIGAVYGWNTVGAIIGVLLAVHIGMPLLGLKGLIILGACVDIALGLFLLWRSPSKKGLFVPVTGTIAGMVAIGVSLLFVTLDTQKMASGVYRTGKLYSPDTQPIVYHQDGKTATVNLMDQDKYIAILTNGKSDAMLAKTLDIPPSADESTMILAGALALAFKPDAKTVANIGIGSGLTTHTLLRAPSLKQVDTIEIESKMVEAARGFKARTEATFTDPRSHIYIADAKTYFSTYNKRYDVIISEPSNPWVSGVASLFSKEFYRLAVRHLSENGIFIQWLQLYEINLDLVASMLKALSPHFSDYMLYTTNGSDVLIVAKNGGELKGPDPHIFEIANLSNELKRIGFYGNEDFELRKIGSKRTLDPLFASNPIPLNSDYFPIVDLGAVKTRFLQSTAFNIFEIMHTPIPVLEMLGEKTPTAYKMRQTRDRFYQGSKMAYKAAAIRDFYIEGHFDPKYSDISIKTKQDAILVKLLVQKCNHANNWKTWISSVYEVFVVNTPYLTPQEWRRMWASLNLTKCHTKLNSTQRSWLALINAVGERNAEAMAAEAEVLLSNGKKHSHGQHYYMLATAMLGNIVQGNQQKVRELWKTYTDKIGASPANKVLFSFLLAYNIQSEMQATIPPISQALQ